MRTFNPAACFCMRRGRVFVFIITAGQGLAPTAKRQVRSHPTKRQNKNGKFCEKIYRFGAGNQNRTDDLVITNDVLYRLSHTSDLVIISYQNCFVKRFFHFLRLNFRKFLDALKILVFRA